MKTKRSGVLRWWLVLPALALTAACATQPTLPPLEAVKVTTKQVEVQRLKLPRPQPVQPVQGIEPIAMTPAVSAQWNQEVRDGERPVYGLICFNTQDRLNYQAWVDSLLAYIAQQREIIEVYEAR